MLYTSIEDKFPNRAVGPHSKEYILSGSIHKMPLTARASIITCERCMDSEVIDYPEELFDFRFIYGHSFCEACMRYWIENHAKLKNLQREVQG